MQYYCTRHSLYSSKGGRRIQIATPWSAVTLQVTSIVHSEPVSPHQDEVCPVWGSCALSPAVLYCCSFGGVCWVPFQQWDTPGVSHPTILLLFFHHQSCENFTTFCHWWQRNDRVLGKSQLNAECKRKFCFAYNSCISCTVAVPKCFNS